MILIYIPRTDSFIHLQANLLISIKSASNSICLQTRDDAITAHSHPRPPRWPPTESNMHFLHLVITFLNDQRIAFVYDLEFHTTLPYILPH